MANQEELERAFGSELKRLREKVGLSQEELAFEAGVDQSTLSKVERFGPAELSWSRLKRVANALGARLDLHLVEE